MKSKATLLGILLAASLIAVTWTAQAAAAPQAPGSPKISEAAPPPPPQTQDCERIAPRAHRGLGHRDCAATPPGLHGRHRSGERQIHAEHEVFDHQHSRLAATRFLHYADKLALTDSQIEQLEELAYNTRLKLIDMQSDLKKAHLEMKHETDIDQDDLPAIRKQLRSLADKRLEIKMLKIENRIESTKILNDEQKKLVRE